MLKKFFVITIILILGFGVLIISALLDEEIEKKPLIDNQGLYVNEQIDVKEVYITILPPSSQFPEYNYTFKDLNTNIYDTDTEVRVIFQEGKDGVIKPGSFGYGLTDANATMKLRGQSSRLKEQKSYKIELNKKVGTWNDQKVINLNKHPFDDTRIRNKLSFDYLKLIPNITSLQTEYVHVYIKDYSEGDYSQQFVDYGLFTQIENLDEDFFKKRDLDAKGSLYKAEYFEFYRYSDVIKLKEDPAYDKNAFEEILEIKGDNDHSKLIAMLNDVNNEFIHINDVIDKHFERDNYITWLAINLLIDNVDTNSKNYYLYSPSNSDKWYFLPWDYDKGWSKHRFDSGEVGLWQQGISNYWGVVLHRRFFMNDENIKDLSREIEYLASIFTEENTRKLLDSYTPIITEYLGREPDSLYTDLDEVLIEIDQLPSVINDSKKRYYESLERPMPVFMGNPEKLGDYYIFRWTESYDLQGDYITYNIEISDSPTFENIIYTKEGIRESEYIVKGIPSGKYYWRLGIADSQGNKQAAFDYYIDENNLWYFGIKEFYIHD